MRRRVADDSPFKKVDLKNAFANYALHFSLSAFYFVVGCQRDFLFGLVKFVFSKKTTKIDKIFTDDLTLILKS